MATSYVGSGQDVRDRPRSVEEITDEAQKYGYDKLVPLKYWLRSANNMLREADLAERNGDDARAYELLFRHAHFVLTHATEHPQAGDLELRVKIAQAQKDANRNLNHMDKLRPRIRRRYESFLRVQQERAARKEANYRDLRAAQEADIVTVTEEIDNTRHLDPRQHADLAVQLHQKASSVRYKIRKKVDDEDLHKRMQDIRRRVDPASRHESQVKTDEPPRRTTITTTYKYPAVSSYAETVPKPTVQPLQYRSIPERPPNLPPRPQAIVEEPPLRPEKLSNYAAPQLPFKEDMQPPASKPRPTTPESSYVFTPTAYLESGAPLRTIFLPPTLRTTFLRLAQSNTSANLETCAFLAGTLVSNALFVNKLILPSQTSTSDTCEMTNESQLFDFVDAEPDLMILGWIHTHPSQTCFMSSRDLHTHAGYQMMLSESIAIVCAPSKGDVSHGGEWNIFRLTDPPGKMAILECHKPGVFHPHDVEYLYTDANKAKGGGHVVLAEGLKFDIADLR